MQFWILMIVVLFIDPVLMIILGKYFIKRAPKEINSLWGYRTSMSMKNQDTWQFAHNYFGKLWVKTGLFLLLSPLLMLIVINKDIKAISYFGLAILFLQVIFMIITIILTEKALRKNFDKSGNRLNR